MGWVSTGNTSIAPSPLSGTGLTYAPPLYPLTLVGWIYFKPGVTCSSPFLDAYTNASSYCNTMDIVNGTLQTCGNTYTYYPGTNGLITSLGGAVTAGSWCMCGVSWTTSKTLLYCYNSAQGKEYYSSAGAVGTAGATVKGFGWFGGNSAYAVSGNALYSNISVFATAFNGQADFTELARGLSPIDFAVIRQKNLWMYLPLKSNYQQFGSVGNSFYVWSANAPRWGADAPVRNPIRHFPMKSSVVLPTYSTSASVYL